MMKPMTFQTVGDKIDLLKSYEKLVLSEKPINACKLQRIWGAIKVLENEEITYKLFSQY